MDKLVGTCTKAAAATTAKRSQPHTIDRITTERCAVVLGARPVTKPGGRWKLRVAPTNYRLRRGDALAWTDETVFWTPRHSRDSRKEVPLRLVRPPVAIID